MQENELVEFAFAKCGGKDQLLLEFTRSKIVAMVRSGATIRDFLAAFPEDQEWALNVQLSALSLIADNTSAAPAKTRMSSDAIQEACGKALEVIGASTHGLSRSKLSEALGLGVAQTRSVIAKLRENGKIAIKGERKDAVYFKI